MKEYNIDIDKYSNVISNSNGVLEVIDTPITHNVVEANETTDLFLVHTTDYFPNNRMILSNSDGHKKISFQYEVDDNIFVVKESISPRETVHFCINGKVENTSNGEGKWDEPKFIIIEPYDIHKQEIVSGNLHGGDNFTNGSVKLSDKAILVVREDVFETLTDEQKNMYNIVKYKGNSNQCIDNLFAAMGVPKINNYADDRTHFMSVQFAQEEVLEKRSQAIKLIKNMDLNHHIDNYGFTSEDIAILSKLGTTSRIIDPKAVEKLNEELNLNSEYLASFIMSNGIVKVGADNYCLLSTPEVSKHLNDSDYYIEKVGKSGTGLDELKQLIEKMNIEDYQNQSNLETNYQFDDISVGLLQTLKNFNSIKHLRDSLGLDKDKILVLREDGLYLSDRIEKDVYAGIMVQEYEQKNQTEQLLGNNGNTVSDIKYIYKNITEQQSRLDLISKQAEQMLQAMIDGKLDANGQPIVDNQETMTNTRQMGFVKIWILGIITVIISIVIVVLGITLTK